MKDQKQIEKMAKDICHARTCEIKKNDGACYKNCKAFIYAFRAVNAGYRKQSEGEWIVCGMFDDFLKCSICGDKHPWQTETEYKYCPNCGARMKGE